VTNKPSQTTQSTWNVKQLFGSKNVRNSTDTRGSYKVIPPIFFLRNYDYNYNEIYIYHAYILHKVDTIFPQSHLQLLKIQTLSPSQEVGNRRMGVFARAKYNKDLFPVVLQ